MQRFPLLVAILLLSATAVSGCVSHEDKAGSAARDDGSKSGSGVPEAPRPQGGSGDEEEDEESQNLTRGQQWHYHNYWGNSPSLVIFEGAVPLDAASPSVSAPPPRATAGEGVITLPRGSVVPPETGRIDVTLEWEDVRVPARLDVAYKPVNADAFVPAGSVENGDTASISVTHDMADAPHTAVSGWAFRITPSAEDTGIAAGNGTVWATVVATMGRPLLIDPPHVDHWEGADTLPLASASRTVHGAGANAADGTYARVDQDEGSAAPATTILEVPVTGGRVVPEGARVVLVRLAWDSPVPPDAGTPRLHYAEARGETSGEPEPESEQTGERVYRVPVEPRMTDNPYGNQSTWSFSVRLDGDAGAFSGTVTLDAWVSRLPADRATLPAGRAT